MERFEPPLDRRGTFAEKWHRYRGRDVLPFWVADMDLPTAPFVLDAVRRRLEHPILGYTATPAPLVDAFLGWAGRRYGWRLDADWLVWIPAVVPGFNIAAAMLAERGHVVIPTPVYPPFLKLPGQRSVAAELSRLVLDRGRWVMDFDDLGAKLKGSAAMMFCNPHNPTGRVYERAELETLAELCLASGAVMVSDEIHCPLILDPDRRHIPIASLDPALESRSITLFAPTKSYNFPGLAAAVAVIPDAALRERFEAARGGLMHSGSALAYAALTAAFADDSTWLDELCELLRSNGRRLERAVGDIDGIAVTHVEGTYLAWLDVSALRAPNPAAAFEAHGLGLSDGAEFGDADFLRFNFGCPRSLLERGIERLANAARALCR